VRKPSVMNESDELTLPLEIRSGAGVHDVRNSITSRTAFFPEGGLVWVLRCIYVVFTEDFGLVSWHDGLLFR
jgi:hypothetical protein